MSQSYPQSDGSKARYGGGYQPPGHPVAPGDVDPLKVVVLDPSTAARNAVGSDVVLLPTPYVADRLLLEGGIEPNMKEPLADYQRALDAADLGVKVDFSVLRDESWTPFGVDSTTDHWVTSLTLTPQSPGVVVDAWTALDAIRGQGFAQDRVTLDHVLGSSSFAAVGGIYGGVGGIYGGVGGIYGGVGGIYGGVGGPAEYDFPGRGGRAPVWLPGRDPRTLLAEIPTDAPVVVLPDSGLGRHPWFPVDDPGVVRGLTIDGHPLGGPNADANNGVIDPMTGAFGPLAGHGTFIAGLIRQGCPEATIVSIPVMSQLGLADEGTVRQTLALLLRRHVAAGGDRSKGAIDIVSLSMGYYPEDYEAFNSGGVPPSQIGMAKLFAAFAAAGVIVVAGAGNDATNRPFVPAALSVTDSLSGVGAVNPNQSSVALFSNDATWVNVRRAGAAVVSTVPTTFDAGAQVSTKGGAFGRTRSTIDPDGYSGGFGIWSGTSFATPIVAAELARALVAEGRAAKGTSDTPAERAARLRGELPSDPTPDLGDALS